MEIFMAQCPQCSGEIGCKQIYKHSAFTPIICGRCGAKLHFDTAAWLRLTMPILISLIAAPIVFVVWNHSLLYPSALLGLTIILLIKFIFNLRNIKLRLKRK